MSHSHPPTIVLNFYPLMLVCALTLVVSELHTKFLDISGGPKREFNHTFKVSCHIYFHNNKNFCMKMSLCGKDFSHEIGLHIGACLPPSQ
jgi:hypothetical protein